MDVHNYVRCQMLHTPYIHIHVQWMYIHTRRIASRTVTGLLLQDPPGAPLLFPFRGSPLYPAPNVREQLLPCW